jgi:hypothetical protein
VREAGGVVTDFTGAMWESSTPGSSPATLRCMPGCWRFSDERDAGPGSHPGAMAGRLSPRRRRRPAAARRAGLGLALAAALVEMVAGADPPAAGRPE